MKQDVLSLFPHIDWNLFAFILFMTLFGGILVWIFRRGSKKHYEKMSEMPLKEEHHEA